MKITVAILAIGLSMLVWYESTTALEYLRLSNALSPDTKTSALISDLETGMVVAIIGVIGAATIFSRWWVSSLFFLVAAFIAFSGGSNGFSDLPIFGGGYMLISFLTTFTRPKKNKTSNNDQIEANVES